LFGINQVLIEAVENHMPQAIVIDEIGTKLEAMAASTIAQRGIQLVATAHGVTIENLIMNPSLEMLVGGIQVRIFHTYLYSLVPLDKILPFNMLLIRTVL
jgi:stage III sporulation protein SpoIIIAA